MEIPYAVIDGGGKMPIINGIFLYGRVYEYSIENLRGADGCRRRAVFSGTAERFGEGVSTLCATYEKVCEEQGLLLECGEGSWGGDGFVCLSETGRKILFLAFFDTADPFIVAEYKERRVRALNNLGELWTFSFDDNGPPSIEIGGECPGDIMSAWERRERW